MRILETEIILGMRLLGATKISELVPEMVRIFNPCIVMGAMD